jgi:hypothetical protein
MTNEVEQLRIWIKEEMGSITEETMKLIHDDAPKNKFSVMTGRFRAFEDTLNKIEAILKETRTDVRP